MWSLSSEYVFGALVLPFTPLLILCCIVKGVLPSIKTRYIALSIGLALACFPAIVLLQSLLPTSGNLAVIVLFAPAAIEELIKAFSLVFIPQKKLTSKSFFWIAVILGTSLGCFETIVYQATTWQSILLRTVTAVALHAVCTGLASFFVWRKVKYRSKTPLVSAIVIHVLYNYFASFRGMFLEWFSIACIALGTVLCFAYYKVQKK